MSTIRAMIRLALIAAAGCLLALPAAGRAENLDDSCGTYVSGSWDRPLVRTDSGHLVRLDSTKQDFHFTRNAPGPDGKREPPVTCWEPLPSKEMRR